MAGIDKTYVTAIQLKEAVEWCKNIGECTLENRFKFKPINFIYGYNDFDNPNFDWNCKEYILWNTPIWFDRWLWLNCPLSFVRERIKEVNSEESLKDFEEWKYIDPKTNPEFGKQHYKFLKVPKWHGHKWFMSHGRRNNPYFGIKQTYFIEIKKSYTDELGYCEQTKAWNPYYSYLPAYGNYVWNHKNPPTKKSIIRQLRKWYIPKGYIVRVYQIKYYDMDFEILVK